MSPPIESSRSRLPHRQVWMMTGGDVDSSKRLSGFLADLPASTLRQWLWVTDSADTLPAAHRFGTVRPGRQLVRILGDEFAGLVLDWRRGWNTNHLSQAVGALAAGGALIILLAEESRWEVTYGWSPASPARYFRYWLGVWEASGARWITAATPPLNGSALTESRAPVSPARVELTAEQAQAEAALMAMPGKRKARVVVTGPRGSGKTTVLARATHRLAAAGQPVLVTGALTDTLNRLRCVLHEDTLCRAWERLTPEEIRGALVLVDEAAVLGLERLRWLTRNAKGIAFFSTVEGYEGSGQGFLLRFLPWLRQAGQAREIELPDSLRWASDDPVSAAYRRSTLQPAGHTEPAAGPLSGICRVDPAESLMEEGASDWVRLLSEAHYQTRPEDIRQCIDDPTVVMWAQYAGHAVVGLLVGLREPPIDDGLAKAVWHGERRPGNQLAKQSLIGQLGYRECAAWSGMRVWRLVVHAEWRRQGAGRRLIDAALGWAESERIDYVAVSYGLTASLSAFWSATGFHLVRVGARMDPASGEHSALELRCPGGARTAPDWFSRAGTLAGERLILGVPMLDRPVGGNLLLVLAARLRPPDLGPHELGRLRHWCASTQPDDSLVPTLSRVLWHIVNRGSVDIEHPLLWAERLWLGYAWNELQQRHRFRDRKHLVYRFRQQLLDCLGGVGEQAGGEL